MKREDARIGREGGKWTVSVRRGAESAAEAAWLCLGGCGDPKVAVRLWLGLMGGSERK